METVQNFITASLGTLGIFQLVPPMETALTAQQDPDLLLKSAISLLAGVLSTVLLKHFKNKKSKTNTQQNNKSKNFKNN